MQEGIYKTPINFVKCLFKKGIFKKMQKHVQVDFSLIDTDLNTYFMIIDFINMFFSVYPFVVPFCPVL